MFIAPAFKDLNDVQKKNDCRMQDQTQKMYKKLESEGYFGDYNDCLTAKYEEDIHKMHVGVLVDDNTIQQFFQALTAFYEYYKTKANKIDPDTTSLEWVRERIKKYEKKD